MTEPVRVYVWVSHIKSRSPGHVALQIGGGKTPDDGYVSFAPEVQGSVSGPGKFYDKSHDDKHYNGRGVWIGTIWGLDIAAMREQLREEYERGMHYSYRNECATTVKRILIRGGGDKLASWWSQKNVGPISPDDVEDFARSIVKNTKPNGSYSEKINGVGTTWLSKESQPKLNSRN